jgi:phenylpyruvate tautomerase PptA (4-oxalocrotonate tautomerase family)
MPVYTVTTQFTPTSTQRQSLASAITQIHSSLFTTPKLFVNVHFKSSADAVSFVGGKERSTNSILGFVRHNESRSNDMYTDLCNKIGEAWAETFGLGEHGKDARDGHANGNTEEKKLAAIFIQGTLLAAWEQGVMVPPAGQDKQWLKQHWNEFKKRADAGNEQMKEFIEDVQSRGLV